MKTDFLRYWSILDLHVLRPWLTDARIRDAQKIDNKDGTYGIALDLHSVPPEAFIATSDCMQRSLAGEPFEPLSTCAPRVLPKPPCLQELVAKHNGYNKITAQAWAEYDRAVTNYLSRMRYGELDKD
jgi:hypothetical protein